MNARSNAWPLLISLGLMASACSDTTTTPDGGAGDGGSTSDAGPSGDGSSGGNLFSFNDVQVELYDVANPPTGSGGQTFKKPKAVPQIGWNYCPIADCRTADLVVRGDAGQWTGKVYELGYLPPAPLPNLPDAPTSITDEVANAIFAVLRPSAAGGMPLELRLTAAGKTTTLSMVCPEKPNLTDPTGALTKGATATAKWSPFRGGAQDSGGVLSPASSYVAMHTWGEIVGLAPGSLSGGGRPPASEPQFTKQLKPTDTEYTLRVPTGESAPNATKAVIALSAAGTIVDAISENGRPSGGEGNCSFVTYRFHDWN